MRRRGDALLLHKKCGELFGQLAGVKQPMQVGAEHIGLHTPFRRAVGQNAERAALHCRAPGVDLVAGQLCPGKGDGPGGGMGLAQLLFGVEHSVRGQKRQPAQGAGGAAFFAVRIGKGVPQHLVAAAHAQHRGALRGQLEHRRFQPALTQPQQVVYGVLVPGRITTSGVPSWRGLCT